MSEIYEGNVQSKCHLAQLFLDTLAVNFYEKRTTLEKIFLQLWKCNFLDFTEISEHIKANTNLQPMKIETFYIVAVLSGTYC